MMQALRSFGRTAGSVKSVHPSMHMPMHMPIHLPTHMSIRKSKHVSLPTTMHPCIHVSAHIPIHMFAHMSMPGAAVLVEGLEGQIFDAALNVSQQGGGVLHRV